MARSARFELLMTVMVMGACATGDYGVSDERLVGFVLRADPAWKIFGKTFSKLLSNIIQTLIEFKIIL